MMEDYFLVTSNDFTEKYDDFQDHSICPEIMKAHRLVWCLLHLCPNMVKRVSTVTGTRREDLDHDTLQNVMAELQDCRSMNE